MIAIYPSTEPQSLPGSAVPLLFGPGTLDQLPHHAGFLGTRILLVSDPGLVRAGHVDRAAYLLHAAGLTLAVFTDVAPNPTTACVQKGLLIAQAFRPDLLVALGGGSAMDSAKAINFLYTNGGRMQDYWGVNKATRPMLPMIDIPTTTGTGSEAQCAALITDPETHQKMACLDKKVLARLAILDPLLAATQPRSVAAATGIDAIAHAVETAACRKRTDTSRQLSQAAWALLSDAFPSIIASSQSKMKDEKSKIADMLLGAHLAGCAIENAMLGAAHAAANPLTALFGTPHGHAVGLMLPHVVRFNSRHANPYSDLDPDPARLAQSLDEFLRLAKLPRTLRELTAPPPPKSQLPALAALAEKQWTAQFNPIPLTRPHFLALYESAY
jgi:alcohol dehydrogenase